MIIDTLKKNSIDHIDLIKKRSLSTCEIVLSTLTIETQMRRITYFTVTLISIHSLQQTED